AALPAGEIRLVDIAVEIEILVLAPGRRRDPGPCGTGLEGEEIGSVDSFVTVEVAGHRGDDAAGQQCIVLLAVGQAALAGDLSRIDASHGRRDHHLLDVVPYVVTG